MRPDTERPSEHENPETTMTTHTTTAHTETTESLTVPDIDDLRLEIDRLDAAILEAIQRRTEVSQMIGKARMASGGTRLVHSREMKVIERYSVLGEEGKNLAMLLLRLGRGRLGH
ncbi:chorismate mutase [Mycobacterium sp. 236(2023)]|uniref:chorismate mutase n=1 Tax=Mycobacterium sp. 236(2023) TaxID=3038163 RepID=UPI0024151B29|nr:chorismate mutase [Mycobacterium sp. 236(2023)]MDG4665817.1 chorismate mutase [Mycobacterium sp. 236(2023)]